MGDGSNVQRVASLESGLPPLSTKLYRLDLLCKRGVVVFTLFLMVIHYLNHGYGACAKQALTCSLDSSNDNLRREETMFSALQFVVV